MYLKPKGSLGQPSGSHRRARLPSGTPGPPRRLAVAAAQICFVAWQWLRLKSILSPSSGNLMEASDTIENVRVPSLVLSQTARQHPATIIQIRKHYQVASQK